MFLCVGEGGVSFFGIAQGVLAPSNFSQKTPRITVNAPGAQFYHPKSIAFTLIVTVPDHR